MLSKLALASLASDDHDNGTVIRDHVKWTLMGQTLVSKQAIPLSVAMTTAATATIDKYISIYLSSIASIAAVTVTV